VEVDIELARSVFDTNVLGTMRMCNEFVDLLIVGVPMTYNPFPLIPCSGCAGSNSEHWQRGSPVAVSLSLTSSLFVMH
jgi:hypothetical protein